MGAEAGWEVELGSGGVEVLGHRRGRLGSWFMSLEEGSGDGETGSGGNSGGGVGGCGAGGGAEGGELLDGEEVGALELGFPHRMQLRRLVLARAMALEILTLA